MKRLFLMRVGRLALLCVVALLMSACLRKDDEKDRDDIIAENLRQIRSLPYSKWVAEETDEEKKGVVLYDDERVWPGVNVYSSRPTNKAFMVSMTGELLHTWSMPYGENDGWQHVEPAGAGKVFVVVKDKALLKLDKDSNLEWMVETRAHHDVALAANGDVLVLTRKIVDMPHGTNAVPLLADYITVVSSKGKVKKELSLLDLFGDSITPVQVRKIMRYVKKSPNYRKKIEPGSLFDIFHANSIEFVENDNCKPFRKGQLLISLLMLNLVAVIDLEKETVVWSWGDNDLEWQHHPSFTPDGKIVIFDNGTHKRYSRIVEVDPVENHITWTYVAEPRESFFSGSRGGSQPLPNGNVLVTESDRGRVFEVSRKGEIVWEFFNPHFVWASRKKRMKRAAIYRVIRLDESAAAFLTRQ